METLQCLPLIVEVGYPYSLGILTEWKLEEVKVSKVDELKSLLARDIN